MVAFLHILAEISSASNAYLRSLGAQDITMHIGTPTDKSRADFVSNVAFTASKQLGKPPISVAETLCTYLSQSPYAEYFTFAFAMPGFINLTGTTKWYQHVLTTVLETEHFGSNTSLTGTKWAVEHTSPNPNKAMHIGHLRNNVTGMAIANILQFSGATVIRDEVDNNRGIAIAKAMWGYLRFFRVDGQPGTLPQWITSPSEWHTPASKGLKDDHFVGDAYLAGADDCKANPDSDAAVRDLALRWEQHDQDVWKLWTYMIDLAHAGIEQTLSRLGNLFDQVWHEHEHYQEGKDFIDQGLAMGVFTTLPDGAVLTQLETYKLPDTIVRKSDGTSLYITQDIALTKKKKDTYQADRYIWVIGPEQATAMKQLFAVCEQLGIGKYDDFTHIPYGLVKITDGEGNVKKMSSRGGTTLLIDDLIDDVVAKLTEAQRGTSKEDIETLAVSAIKYGILRVGRMSDVTLDLDQTISLQGDSGVYVMYTFGRINSLLSKLHQALKTTEPTSTEWIFSPSETMLIKHMMYFPATVQAAASDFAPNLITEHLLTLAQEMNSLYGHEKFLSDDIQDMQRKRAIAEACKHVMLTAMTLIGMKPVEHV